MKHKPFYTNAHYHSLDDRITDLILDREDAEKQNRREKSILDVAGIIGGAFLLVHGLIQGPDESPFMRHVVPFLGVVGMVGFTLELWERHNPKTRAKYDPGAVAHHLDEQLYDMQLRHWRDPVFKYKDTPENCMDRAASAARRVIRSPT